MLLIDGLIGGSPTFGATGEDVEPNIGGSCVDRLLSSFNRLIIVGFLVRIGTEADVAGTGRDCCNCCNPAVPLE